METPIIIHSQIYELKDILHSVRSYFNVILLAVGIWIICDASSTKAHFNEFDTLLVKQYFYLIYLFYAMGIIILIIGIYGVMRGNHCTITKYYGWMVVVFLIELMIIYDCYPRIIEYNKELAGNMNKTMNLYDSPTNSRIAMVWDNIQQQFHCCGISGASDWISSTATKNKLPLSCCFIPYGATDHFECNTNVAYKEGCLEVFRNDINSYIYYIDVFSISVAVIQGFGLFLVFCFYCCFRTADAHSYLYSPRRPRHQYL